MEVKQIYTNCLAQGAYYIENNGEAAIIDPLREVEPYIQLAKERNATIKYIFETHFHADFVSGHIDLSKKTAAPIIYGPTNVETGFPIERTTDGQVFKLGNATITLIHTPGHTMESSCYLLKDENGKATSIFTGDTLFIGDVGRPDLAQKINLDLTEEKLAGYLFDSLREKIMPLDDDIIVYPAHGAGSACGKNMSKETSDTLGNQKKTNYALNPALTKDQFIKEVLTGLVTPPSYFPENVLMNIKGYDSIDDVVKRALTPLSADEFEKLSVEKDVIVLDVRDPELFVKGFVPGSINIGLNGSFAVWVGTLIKDIRQKLILITPEGKEEETATRLARVGYDFAMGFLKGGIENWKAAGKKTENITSVSVEEFAKEELAHSDISILDVRKKSEYVSEHIIGADNKPLDFIFNNMNEVEKDKKIYVHCAGGYRSVIYCSIMKKNGYHNLINVAGGFKAIKNSGAFALTDYVCPTTLL